MSDQNSLISTSSLFHYTYSYDNMLSILKDGFKPKYSLEKLSILKTDDLLKSFAETFGLNVEPDEITDELAIAMVCFCDIPLNLVGNHINIYGKYAIGLTKDWGVKNAISPVFYISDSETRFFFEALIRITHRIRPKIHEKVSGPTNEDLPLFIEVNNLINANQNLIMFVKPYQGKYERKRIGFLDKNYRFYDEREWRYRPPNFLTSRTYLTSNEYNDPKEKAKHEGSLFNVTFNTADITHILIPENEIPKLKKELKSHNLLTGLSDKIIEPIENYL